MLRTDYLIVGSSHAGLTAAEEIRLNDPKGSITMVTKEDLPPYSPTILPHVIAGKISPARALLRNLSSLKRQKIKFLKGSTVVSVDASRSTARLFDGRCISYQKLLIATGAEPVVPGIEGLEEVPYLKLRTMEDAKAHLGLLRRAQSAIVMGTGLVGMHAAENFVGRGLKVDVVRARPKRRPRILPNYFDEEASAIIREVFEQRGVRFHLKNHAVEASPRNGRVALTLYDGTRLQADILLVCTGIRPRIEFLADSGVKCDQGILVDRGMRTSVENIWAAGDVAQADDFFTGSKVLNAILPDAVLQGKVAGANMSEGHLDEDYPGALSMNIFNFFGNRAFSIGMHSPATRGSYSVDRVILPSARVYKKLVFQGDVLVGASSINTHLDPGITSNIILRRIELREGKAQLVDKTVEMSRRLMWKYWR